MNNLEILIMVKGVENSNIKDSDMAQVDNAKKEFYNYSVEDLYQKLQSTKNGLFSKSIAKRQELFGRNELKTKSGINPFKIFIGQFKDFLIYMLLFAAGFSLLIHEYIDAIIILIILIANAVIGFFQELNAQKSLEALKKLTLIDCNVYRDGKLISLDSKELVVGDIIYLEAGDRVPADCRIIEATRLKVQEASLTGESLPVNKNENVMEGVIALGDRKNMLFSSTEVVEGTAKAIVVSIGMNTEIGKITNMVQEAKEEMTPLQKKLDQFGKFLGYIIIGICIIVFATLFTREYMAHGMSKAAILEFMLIAISLAVAAVPTALPAVVTVALSRGVNRLLAKKCLVKKLSSVETLGCCDVICTDKTGTLTKNEMTVQKVWTLDAEANVSGLGYNPEGEIKLVKGSKGNILDIIHKVAVSCNNAEVYQDEIKDDKGTSEKIWKITGDPTEAALIVSAKKAGITKDILSKSGFKRIDELPFDSDRKLMSVLIDGKENGKRTVQIFTKGAPDQLLAKCDFILVNGKKTKLTPKLRKQVLDQNENYGKQALRVLAFGYKEIDPKKVPKNGKNCKEFKEENLIFLGLQAMIDPPREDVIDSISKCKEAGIRVIMITGDHKITANAIAENIGINGKVLTGKDVENMDNKELTKALQDDTNIFARVIPEHKQRIVDCLQKLNYTVAMTGDGVNDAPALKKANIGVAVGSGTEVAKEASDFVLIDDSFSNIVNAVEEGRGLYDNIQKSIMLLLSGNIGEVLIVFLAALFGYSMILPAILLLWINLITDGAPALAYSVDPYGKNIMQRKPRPYKEPILPHDKLSLISILGIIGTFIALVMFNFVGGNSGIDSLLIIAQTMVFNFVVLYELILTFLIRKDYGVPLFTNKWLWIAVVFSIAMQGVLMYVPFFRNIFEIAALELNYLLILVASGIIFFAIAQVYYAVFHIQIKRKKVD